MKRIMISLALLALVLVSACAAAPGGQSEAPPVAPAPSPAPAPGAPPGGGGGFQDAPSADERMVVRTGDISLVVDDVVVARDMIADMAERLGGYVVNSRIYGEERDRRASISIRVPDDDFEAAFDELRDLAVRVRTEHTNSEDVTEQYIDLEARLKNAEATEQQYLALLDRATQVEDILRIYDSLSRVRSEIEQIKGRMQYLERTSSMALIQVSLEPEVSGGGLIRAGWSALETLKSAIRGIVIFAQVLGTVGIWLLIFSPVWGGIAFLVYRLRRRKR